MLASDCIVCIPDSHCGISQLVVSLHAWLKPSELLYLIPDGHFTTAPLNLSGWKIKTQQIISPQEILERTVALGEITKGSKLRYLTMVSLKCPTGLTKAKLKDACTVMLLNAGKQLTNDQSAIAVCCHRTIEPSLAEQYIRQAHQQLMKEGRHVWFDIIDVGSLDPSCLEALHTIPSTIIWEIWAFNPTMRLTLYDLRSLALSKAQASLHQSLSHSLELTRQEALRLSKAMVADHCEDYGIRQEVWESVR